MAGGRPLCYPSAAPVMTTASTPPTPNPPSGGLARLAQPTGTLALLLGVALTVACATTANPPARGGEAAAAAVPDQYLTGQRLFEQHCARCHGIGGQGTDQGPPFLSPIYRPDHHADESFVLAAQRGVTPHHWRFGAMPSIPEVTRDEVRQITAYVRWLQREAGVY